MYKVTKKFTFECSHRLENHPAGCKNNHGHSYKLFVTIKANNLNDGSMVLDFTDLTQVVNPIVESFDHSYVYDVHSNDVITTQIVNILSSSGLKVTPFEGRVTAENMCKYFHDIIKSRLYSYIDFPFSVCIKLYETEKSYAEYYEEDSL